MFTNDQNIDNKTRDRREIVFLVLSGIFLGSLAMLNILGITRFVDLSFNVFQIKIPFVIAVGVLPYPITFLCTDLISELFGRKRANRVVIVGLILNIWVLFVLWLGGALSPPEGITEEGRLQLLMGTDGNTVIPKDYAFYEIRFMAFGATAASMLAYLTAQFVDVHVFHYIKKKTHGKHMWIRNNVSTLTSQLIDSVAVILITYYYAKSFDFEAHQSVPEELTKLILAAYIFKVVSALLDTIPFYYITKWLSKYLQIDHEKTE